MLAGVNPENSPPALEALLYDAFMAAEEPGDEEFFGAEVAAHGGPALELGCGSGRVLLALARGGLEVEGLDCSPEMLAVGRARAAAAGLELAWHQARMESFRPARRYGTIYAPGFGFQLLSDEAEARGALAQWRGWLLAQGRLLLTAYWPWEVDEGLASTDWEEYNELAGEALEPWLEPSEWAGRGLRAQCATRAVLDHAARRLTRLHRYRLLDASGGLLSESHSALEQLWWRPEQMAEACRAAGFTRVELLSGFTEFPWEDGDGLWTVRATG